MVQRLLLALAFSASVYAQSFAPTIPPRSKDSDASHVLRYLAGSNLSADRTLTFTTGDANRALTLSADVSLDQSLLTTGAPSFESLLLSPLSEIAWQVRPLDYGTTYDGQGTSDAYRFFSGQGSQSPNIVLQTLRSDLAFGEGYNCNSSGARIRSDEMSWIRNKEFKYFQDTGVTFTLSGAPSYNAGTGYSTVTTASTPFTAAMVDTCAVRFASTYGYPIVEYVSTSQVRVLGDASAQSTSGVQIWYGGIETYDQVMYADLTTARVNNVNFWPHNKKIIYVQRATSAQFRREDDTALFTVGGSTIGDSNVFIEAGNLYLSKSSGQIIYGKNSSNAVSGIISLDNATNWIGLGQSTLTNGIRLGVPLLAGNDAVTGIFLGNGSGKSGGAQGETKVINFTGVAYGADGMLPRLYLEHAHIAIKVNGVSDTSGLAEMRFGTGTTYANLDTNLYRASANVLATGDDFAITTEGKGFQIKQGANGKSNTVTLTGNTEVTVTNSSVTANSIIDFQQHAAAAVADLANYGEPILTAKSAGSFKVASTNNADTRVLTYIITEPAP